DRETAQPASSGRKPDRLPETRPGGNENGRPARGRPRRGGQWPRLPRRGAERTWDNEQGTKDGVQSAACFHRPLPRAPPDPTFDQMPAIARKGDRCKAKRICPLSLADKRRKTRDQGQVSEPSAVRVRPQHWAKIPVTLAPPVHGQCREAPRRRLE